MAGSLEGRGFRRAAHGEPADVVLLNTCAVREKAEHKVYSALGVLGREKQARPALVIGVTGCVAQVESEEILERAPWVDFVLGTGNVEKVGALVERLDDRAVGVPGDGEDVGFVSPRDTVVVKDPRQLRLAVVGEAGWRVRDHASRHLAPIVA